MRKKKTTGQLEKVELPIEQPKTDRQPADLRQFPRIHARAIERLYPRLHPRKIPA